MVLNINLEGFYENCGKRTKKFISALSFYISKFFDHEVHESFWEEVGPI